MFPQPHGAPAPKLAIPRLPTRAGSSRASADSRKRTSLACLPCRTRKVKCDGDRPMCGTCRTLSGAQCAYEVGRKDKLKTTKAINQRMAQLLRELEPSVTAGTRRRINELLDEVEDGVGTSTESGLLRTPHEGDSVPDDHGEAYVSADVGSNNELDAVDEDLLSNEETRATGFMGQGSNVQLMRRLHQEAGRPRRAGPYGPPGHSPDSVVRRVDATQDRKNSDDSVPRTSSYSFYLDDKNADLDMDLIVDPSEMPPFETAELLLFNYMRTVHDAFPLLSKRKVVADFYSYYRFADGADMSPLLPQTRALLNLIFAVGAVYSHLIDAPWQADSRDHLIFHSRARALAVEKAHWWDANPDLFRLQTAGLCSLYYLTIGHVNRSWIMTGTALRTAYALGMHVRNDDPTVTAAKRENRIRIWWGLYSLETLLCTITGRPSAVLPNHISTPYPLPLETDEIDDFLINARFGNHPRSASIPFDPSINLRPSASPSTPDEPVNAGSFLKHSVRVNAILAGALNDLYAAGTVNRSWESVQKNIAQLLERLQDWATVLPSGFSILDLERETMWQRQEILTLALYYYNTKILITRPCLCRLDRRIINQSTNSNDFNIKSADSCVEAARGIAALLPDGPGPAGIMPYHLTPWWSMVHFLMQAVATLLMNILYTADQVPTDPPENLSALKKLIRCLRSMSRTNASADRAYMNGFRLLTIIATRVSVMEVMRFYRIKACITTIILAASGFLALRVLICFQDISDLELEHVTHASRGPILPASTEFETGMPPPATNPADGLPLENNRFDWSEGGVSASMEDISQQADFPLHGFPNLLVTTYDELHPLPALSDPDPNSGFYNVNVEYRNLGQR